MRADVGAGDGRRILGEPFRLVFSRRGPNIYIQASYWISFISIRSRKLECTRVSISSYVRMRVYT